MRYSDFSGPMYLMERTRNHEEINEKIKQIEREREKKIKNQEKKERKNERKIK